MDQVESVAANDIAKPNRPLVISFGVSLLAVLLGLQTEGLPSTFGWSSADYRNDMRLELRFYGHRLGTFRRTLNTYTRNPREDNLAIEYSSGPHVTNVRVYYETTGLGFLVPLFAYKAGLVVALFAACAALLVLPRGRFAAVATPVAIRLYAVSLLAVGVAGVLLTPPRIILELMAPLYALVWLTYLFAIWAGIAVLRRRKRAAWRAFFAQFLLAYGIFFLVQTIVEPKKWDLPGYRVEHVDWSWYFGAYAVLLLLVGWFLTRPRVRAWLGSSP